jgi:hypothetical protein
MSMFCSTHRTPRAAVDPVDGPTAALAVVELAMRRPLTHETIALVLDADRRGRTVVVVDGTRQPDAVLDVIERVAGSIAASGRAGCVVLATIRPGGGPEEGDEDRWIEASDLADDVGVELLEWFVIGAEAPTVAANAWCPRDLVGEAPRW